MKSTKPIFWFLLIGILFYSCEKEESKTILDKKIIIPLITGSLGTFTGGSNIINYSTSLINFNKQDYSEIDSISFIISDLSVINSFSLVTLVDTLQIELYDLTNKIIIENSGIETNYISPGNFLASSNIYNSLPDSGINIAIRITNKYYTSYYYSLKSADLILVRK
jgi:hypothetical protein